MYLTVNIVVGVTFAAPVIELAEQLAGTFIERYFISLFNYY